MTDELKSAIDRLRRIYAGESLTDVYTFAAAVSGVASQGLAEAWRDDDYKTVAEAHLARLAKDEAGEEPITEDRLAAIGFTIGGMFASKLLPSENGDPVEMFLLPEDGDEWSLNFEQSNNNDVIAITSRKFRTMNDIRRLIEVLEGRETEGASR